MREICKHERMYSIFKQHKKETKQKIDNDLRLNCQKENSILEKM